MVAGGDLALAGMVLAAEINWSGYLRDDITVTDRHLGAIVGNYLGNYLRLRVDLKAYMNKHASLTATPEFTYLSGDRLLDPYTGLPLASDHDVGLNRAQLDLWWERLQITLGKQRLQLSNSYFFSSLDVFNPANYTEPTVEREGVTAARMTGYWSGFSGERLIFVPRQNWVDSPKAARTFVKVDNFEMGATYLEPGYDAVKTTGIDLAGPIGELGLYLEAAGDVDSPEHRLGPRATLGVNWGWRNGSQLHRGVLPRSAGRHQHGGLRLQEPISGAAVYAGAGLCRGVAAVAGASAMDGGAGESGQRG